MGVEDSHGRCGGVMFKQTVPDIRDGDKKSSIANGRQLGAVEDQ